MISRYRPGKRPESTSSISCRSAFRPLSRTSERTRCKVSISSSTTRSPGWPESRRIVSRPCRKPRAAKWSRSPRTPAARRAAAATFGWPPIQAIRLSAVAWSPASGRVPVGAQRRRERGRGAGDLGEPALQQGVHALGQRSGVLGLDRSLGEDVLFQRVEPAVDDLAERARRVGRGGQLLDQAAVDGLQPVQRGLGLGDLDLGGGHAAPLGPLGQPAGEEGLARAVLTADRLERSAARRDAGQLVVEGSLEPLHADREQVKPGLRHGAAPQRVDDFPPPGGAHVRRRGHVASPRNCCRSSSLFSATVRPSSMVLITG